MKRYVIKHNYEMLGDLYVETFFPNLDGSDVYVTMAAKQRQAKRFTKAEAREWMVGAHKSFRIVRLRSAGGAK